MAFIVAALHDSRFNIITIDPDGLTTLCRRLLSGYLLVLTASVVILYEALFL
jgi:hypothetical protein